LPALREPQVLPDLPEASADCRRHY
jgi:hypothetical protein